MNSIFVRKKATFGSFSSIAILAPFHILAPLMSTPIKLTQGKRRANSTVYSPFPQPSSKTMGLELWKYASHQCPFISKDLCFNTEKGYWKTFVKVSISANFSNFPLLIG